MLSLLVNFSSQTKAPLKKQLWELFCFLSHRLFSAPNLCLCAAFRRTWALSGSFCGSLLHAGSLCLHQTSPWSLVMMVFISCCLWSRPPFGGCVKHAGDILSNWSQTVVLQASHHLMQTSNERLRGTGFCHTQLKTFEWLAPKVSQSLLSTTLNVQLLSNSDPKMVTSGFKTNKQNKMAMPKRPNSRLQNGKPQTKRCRHGASVLYFRYSLW